MTATTEIARSAARLTTARLTCLGFQFADGGFDADPVDLLLLAHTARDLGVNEILVSVMVDDDEPAVARARAFARVAAQISRRIDEIDDAPYTSTHELQPAC